MHGYGCSNPVVDPIQDVRIAFLTPEEGSGNPVIELLAPANEKSPVNRILQKVGVSPYHFCYETSDIEASMADLKRQGFVVVSKPVSACALGNKKVCFLFSKKVGLIELVER